MIKTCIGPFGPRVIDRDNIPEVKKQSNCMVESDFSASVIYSISSCAMQVHSTRVAKLRLANVCGSTEVQVRLAPFLKVYALLPPPALEREGKGFRINDRLQFGILALPDI